ncbi:carboxypeptidase M32 [Virgibacillus sp. MSP4-1]|uniref:carboxypeptidase M32 n=1 Tax=Virgibacillus sp. MSP4-1 TaxID=2700081 RepID=UPI0003A4395E|nr:carboxypeptidase M32 [Virgibacillus sp. MSP4-1]QHS22545.1 carboxypeptidase M32 [Virgibacillus sp. MSP4-1]
MSTNYSEREQQFLDYLKQIQAYHEAIDVMYWDLRTKAPKKGVKQRSETIGLLSHKVHQMSTSDTMKHFIDELKGNTQNEIVHKSVLECEKEYERNAKIPDEEFKKYVILQSEAESVWEEAREKADFEMFRPYLEQLVEYNIKFAEYWGYEDNRYDALLDLFEPGMTVNVLDRVFPALRDSLTPLIEKVQQSDHKPDTSKILVPFNKEDQEAFSLEILKEMGYDFDAGRMDETVHPFMIPLNRNDTRVTTRYDERDFRMAVFGTIHEGGHALYEQNLDESLTGTPLATGTSNGIHESQSLFWETYVARSKAFWNRYFDTLKEYAPESIAKLPAEEFYRAVNEVKPSFIRIEADEMTYPLHIMVRYELEKGLINQEIEVKDLPKLWNDKMEEYLGIRPGNDREGVLQDVHWAGGSFGYFPSYALGYMYGAQFYHAMNKDFHVQEAIQNGEINKVKSWLTEKIHQYGKLKEPLEILQDVTGEGLNADYLVEYLEDKYKEIYKW